MLVLAGVAFVVVIAILAVQLVLLLKLYKCVDRIEIGLAQCGEMLTDTLKYFADLAERIIDAR